MDKVILMYHSVGVQGNGQVGANLYCVYEKNFREQMEYVSELAGSRVTAFQPKADPSETVNAQTREQVNAPTLILSFDDGGITNYQYAYPVLKEFGLRAYFFIIVSKVGRRGYMNWEQIKELRDAGMIVGSHGMTHRILTEIKDKEIDYELKASKRYLEDNLGHPIDYFSIPRGFYNGNIITKAKEAGYKGIFTSSIKDNDGFKSGRIAVKRDWDIEYFVRVLDNGLSLNDRTKELIKNVSKKILGTKNYDKIRTAILGA